MHDLPVIVDSGLTSAYGNGVDYCWRGLLTEKSAISRDSRFSKQDFISDWSALVPGAGAQANFNSRLQSILLPAIDSVQLPQFGRTDLILATTLGEIDYLENRILGNGSDQDSENPLRLMRVIRKRTGINGGAFFISAACASSTVALIKAADIIKKKTADSVLVAAGDAVNEFAFAGFSALNALSPQPARPFDQQRSGLTLGESGVALLVMSAEQARREKRPILATLAGSGIASDANHMTGPARDGAGLVRAVEQALHEAVVEPEEISFICAHGTGTIYNDAMEMAAFQRIFHGAPKPLFSIKGGVGHTLGAAGALETLISAEALRRAVVPMSIGLKQPMSEVSEWICRTPLSLCRPRTALTVNSGFGGINAALLLLNNE